MKSDEPRLKAGWRSWSAATIDQSLAKENDDRMDEWFSALIPLLKEVAPEADVEHEANLLIGLVNGLGSQLAVNPTKRNLNRAQSVIGIHLKQLAA